MYYKFIFEDNINICSFLFCWLDFDEDDPLAGLDLSDDETPKTKKKPPPATKQGKCYPNNKYIHVYENKILFGVVFHVIIANLHRFQPLTQGAVWWYLKFY